MLHRNAAFIPRWGSVIDTTRVRVPVDFSSQVQSLVPVMSHPQRGFAISKSAHELALRKGGAL